MQSAGAVVRMWWLPVREQVMSRVVPQNPQSAYYCTTSGGGFLVYLATDSPMTLTQLVESRIRQSTHGRIRDLRVEEVQGLVVVRGNAPSHHTKQLALHGALELLSGQRFSAEITVG